MMVRRINLLRVVAGTLVLTCIQVSEAKTPQASGTDETIIRQIVKQVEDGWNAHDAKAFAAPFGPDAAYVVVNGTKLAGREAIEEWHAPIFTTIFKDSHNVGMVKSIRFLRPDVAVVHVEWNLENSVGGETKKGRAMNTVVMTKDGDKWSIAAFQNTPIRSTE